MNVHLTRRDGALHPSFGRRRSDGLEHQAQDNPLLAQLFDLLPLQLAYYDFPGLICRYANLAYAQMYGRTPEQTVGCHCQSIVTPYCWSDQFHRFHEVWECGTLSYEVGVPGQAGNVSYLAVSLLPCRNAHGSPAGVLVMMQDVTARHLAETALRDSEERLRNSDVRHRQLLDNAAHGIAIVREERILYANPAALAIFGHGDSDPIGQIADDYVHPDDRASVDHILKGIKGSLNRVSFECRIAKPEHLREAGEQAYKWIRITAAVKQWDGQPALQFSVYDISESHKLQAQLRWALAQKEAILNNTAVGVCIARQLTIDWVNGTLADMLGYAPADLTGQSLARLYADDSAMTQAALALGVGQDASATEVELMRKNGQRLWVQVEGKRLRRDNEEIGTSFWTYMDISVRKLAEAEIRQTLARERELAQLKDGFVAMASHEFRTPLTTIQSSSDLLLHYADKLSQVEQKACLQDIQSAVQRMHLVMENILVLGKLNGPQPQSHPVRLPVGVLIDSLVNEVAAADSRLHPFELSSPPDASQLQAQLDEGLVRQIMGNLLNNACKYSAAGQTVAVRWRRVVQPSTADSAPTAPNMLEIEVIDRGIGIPPGDLPKLFNPFHRGSNVGLVRGTGLGLPIVKRAIEGLGGRLDVRSTMGEGSRFTVHLPWID